MSRAYSFINDKMQGDNTIKSRLGASNKFDTLNIHIRNRVVMPGEMVIVPDSSTPSCTLEEAEFMRMAQHVSHQISHNSLGSDGLALKHYDVLQRMLGHASLGIGAVSGSWSNHLTAIEKTLDDIQKLHKLSLTRGTPIARQEFINQRQVLFARLDEQLKGVARWGSGLQNRGSIKKMLGISTKSYLHTGEMRDYARRMEGIARTAKLLKHGTAVGIGLNVVASGLELKEACSVGREEKCEKAAYVEGGKLALGVGFGMKGGSWGAASAVSTCVAVFTIPSVGWGALACGIIGGIAGGYIGGKVGEGLGETAGEKLYEWRPK
ncbi:hypothetical protein M2401_003612 [Pseudomonas sp. JUb42]|uniref:hypothetical protein n=1 Tax=Pseudomonas sp. JUb42 TaxID=2940611 RepID=UPI00216A1E63|nr:hypothetical protein [Pseudomonas sp. JUb42]MCS3469872.1 hypothetical protein [Pseudomonas sp. JUb42]